MIWGTFFPWLALSSFNSGDDFYYYSWVTKAISSKWIWGGAFQAAASLSVCLSLCLFASLSVLPGIPTYTVTVTGDLRRQWPSQCTMSGASWQVKQQQQQQQQQQLGGNEDANTPPVTPTSIDWNFHVQRMCIRSYSLSNIYIYILYIHKGIYLNDLVTKVCSSFLMRYTRNDEK